MNISKKNSIALIRIGEIGDTITAVELCREFNFDLYLLANKKQLIIKSKKDNKFIKNINQISKQMSFPININFNLNQLSRYSKIFLFVQKKNLNSIIFKKVLEIFLKNKKVKIICEGSNYFHISFLKQNRIVKEKIKALISNKNNLQCMICWKGKEEQKNIPKENLIKLIRFLNKKGFSNTLLGDQVIKLKEKGFSNLSGKTSLTQAMEHIDNADLVLSVDTGLLHYAISKKKLCIALVSHRYELSIWYPFNSDTYLISDIFSEISRNNHLDKRKINSQIESIFI